MPTGISMGSIVDLDTATLHIPDMVRTDEYGLRSSVPGKSIPPKTVIEIGKPLEHSKNGSGKFTLKRFEAGFYVCSCPAWLYNQERDKFRRSCPHLSEVLGDEYEEERVRVAKDAPSSVWEDKGITRRASGSTVASRMARARSMLDEQLQEASQKDQGASKDCDGGVSKAVDNADKAPADKASETTSAEDAAASGVAASASSNSKRPAPVGQQDDSETEDEWELVKPVAQAPGPSNAAARTPEAPEAAAGVGKAFSFPWEQPSPSKKGRNGKADKNDDKVKLLLGHSWVLNADPKKPKSKPMDPSGWWVSEKVGFLPGLAVVIKQLKSDGTATPDAPVVLQLDGVRAFWDGQRLFSRQNLEWNAPTWWKDQLPKDLALDGELWMRRGEFDLTSQICRTTVRMGKLRTFKHFLQRDSMERSWLREQLGGRLASQHRIRQEEARRRRMATSQSQAKSQSQSQSQSQAQSRRRPHGDGQAPLGDVTNLASSLPDPPAPTTGEGIEEAPAALTSSGKRASRWKSQKRLGLRVGRDLVQSGEISMFALAQLSFCALLPRPRPRQRKLVSEQVSPTQTCTRCGRGKRPVATSPSELPSNPSEAGAQSKKRKRSDAKTSHASRPSAPPLVTPPSASAAPALATPAARPPRDAVRPGMTSPHFRRRSRFHPANFLPAYRSDTKRSSEWHNIKYMVSRRSGPGRGYLDVVYTDVVAPDARSVCYPSAQVFDAPSMDGKVVEDRWAELKKRFGSTEGIDIDQLQGAVIRLVHHEKCVDRDHLVALLEEVNGKGGEGLMLRRPGSFYEFKRSRTMYKLKSFYDAEAKVVDYVEGEGRNEGRVGALVVEMENGLRTRIGSGLNDRQRENPPPVGTIVSYRFQEITQTGHPRFPSFRGVAHDKTRAKDAIVRPSSIVKVPDDT
ncbi:related to DNA ligase [Pseudozyma flocculosa]|uniref:Related to DNA ligase n=1 Tax=Pseudozyma flocculosa TaxID=84751 RepID=A0A5C3F727_9BASI|nr:related to DNA ligase [Pseudozyma flocculosa]